MLPHFGRRLILLALLGTGGLLAPFTSAGLTVGAAQISGAQHSGSVFQLQTHTTRWKVLRASDGAANDLFGYSLSLSGDTAVIGAKNKNGNTGAAYVFVRDGTTWIQQAELTASNAASGDFLSVDVAFSGNTALVGAYQKNDGRGAAYVFVRNGTTWTQQAELTASDGQAGDWFGVGVGLSDDTAVIGARYKGGSGAAYVFVRHGTTWTQQAELTARNGMAGALFGVVAVEGNTAVIGAYGYNNSTGTAYVFVRTGTTWTQQAELTASDGTANDIFGDWVALSGNTVVIGAAGHNSGAGAAYVFVRNGTTWIQQAELSASDAAPGDYFGYGLSVRGDIAVIGAPYRIGKTGAAYVFARCGTTWTQRHVLTAGMANSQFGYSEVVGRNAVLIGAPVTNNGFGAVYAFARH